MAMGGWFRWYYCHVELVIDLSFLCFGGSSRVLGVFEPTFQGPSGWPDGSKEVDGGGNTKESPWPSRGRPREPKERQRRPRPPKGIQGDFLKGPGRRSGGVWDGL